MSEEQLHFVFHIGMGKTGTSTIQDTLLAHLEPLRQAGIDYLGKPYDDPRLGMGDPSLATPFFPGIWLWRDAETLDERTVLRAADAFADTMRRRRERFGTGVFLLSNEDICGCVEQLAPFMERLRQHGRVSLIVYLRDPASWLRSSYAENDVRYKAPPGPIQPFSTRAHELIGRYRNARRWHERFPDITVLRQHRVGVNVVDDFAALLGVELEPVPSLNARDTDAEMLLRALFNTRFSEPFLGQGPYLERVLDSGHRAPISLDTMAKTVFDVSELDGIIAAEAETFGYLERAGLTGILQEDTPRRSMPEMDDLRTQVMDYLVEIVLQQAERRYRLEEQVGELGRRVRELTDQLASR